MAKQLQVVFISSTDQPTDVFTKLLPHPRFQWLCTKLNVFPTIDDELTGECESNDTAQRIVAKNINSRKRPDNNDASELINTNNPVQSNDH